MISVKKYLTSIILTLMFVFGFGFNIPSTLAATNDLQSQIDDANNQIAELNQKIVEYQAELKALGSDKKTLQSAIKLLDLERSKVETQIAVIQKQISATKLEIKQLGKKIDSKKETIATYKKALAESLRELNRTERESLTTAFFASDSLSDVWKNINTNLTVQDSFREKTEVLKAQQYSLTLTQTAVKAKEKTLATQNKSLVEQKAALLVTQKAKNQLLFETKNKESEYQKLLAQAQAELKSYSAFTKNAGGTKLLANQTVCDSWGCYYNQRDTSWGANALNGTEYTLASDGCLVTSMAMVMTHYGYTDVTPATINGNPANFASYYPAYLSYTISVDGVTASRVKTTIDTTLAKGDPVVVGMRVKGGTHFVVLVSGQDGSYVMRDPYVASAKDVDFTTYYSVKSIYSITKVVVNK